MRYLTLIFILSIVSCKSVYYSENNMAGIYIGHTKSSRKNTIEQIYELHLKTDGTCLLTATHDIYFMEGIGKWTIIDMNIVMEFENRDYDSPVDVLVESGIIKGKKTAKIINTHKLKLDNATLKKLEKKFTQYSKYSNN